MKRKPTESEAKSPPIPNRVIAYMRRDMKIVDAFVDMLIGRIEAADEIVALAERQQTEQAFRAACAYLEAVRKGATQ